MKIPKIVLNTKFPKPTTTFMYQPKKYSNFPNCPNSVRIRAKSLYQFRIEDLPGRLFLEILPAFRRLMLREFLRVC